MQTILYRQNWLRNTSISWCGSISSPFSFTLTCGCEVTHQGDRAKSKLILFCAALNSYNFTNFSTGDWKQQSGGFSVEQSYFLFPEDRQKHRRIYQVYFFLSQKYSFYTEQLTDLFPNSVLLKVRQSIGHTRYYSVQCPASPKTYGLV